MSRFFTLILVSFMFSNVVNAENIYNSRGQKIGKYYTKGNKTTYYNKGGNRTGYTVYKSNRAYHYNNSGVLQYKTDLKNK